MTDTEPALVNLDSRGRATLPKWVKPGPYRATTLPGGQVRLEPLMTREEVQALDCAECRSHAPKPMDLA